MKPEDEARPASVSADAPVATAAGTGFVGTGSGAGRGSPPERADGDEFDVEDGLPPWGQVPRHVMLSKKLTNNDRALYATLATYANRRTREAFPKQSVLGEVLGSERTVRRSAKNLEAAGFLKARQARGATGQFKLTVYRLLGFRVAEDATRRPVEATGRRPEDVSDRRPKTGGSEAYRSKDQRSREVVPAPASPGPSKTTGDGRIATLVDYLFDSISEQCGGVRPVAFGGGHAAKLFSAALKAGDTEESLRKVVDVWVGGARNLTVEAFHGEFNRLRAKALGAQVRAVMIQFPRGGALRASDDDRRTGTDRYLGKTAS